jgi:hypothetical protein
MHRQSRITDTSQLEFQMIHRTYLTGSSGSIGGQTMTALTEG